MFTQPVDNQNEGSMTDCMASAALTGMSLSSIHSQERVDEVACCEILELDIPHEDHIKCIIWIRLVLDPDQPIEDYDDVSLVRYRRGFKSKKG